MKKRQRKKNAKKAIRIMAAMMAAIQAQMTLVSLCASLRSAASTAGGVVQASSLQGELVSIGDIKEIPLCLSQHNKIVVNTNL